MSKIKVLLHNYTNQLGGSTMVTYNIAKYLPNDKYECHLLFHTRGLNEETQNPLDAYESAYLIPDDSHTLIEQSIEYIKQFDIVIDNLVPLEFRGRIRTKVRKPIINILHSVAGWNRIKDQYKMQLPYIENNKYNQGQDIIPDAFVCISQELREIVEQDINDWSNEHGIFYNPDVRTILNCVHLPNSISTPPKQKTIIYVGRISSDKGIDRLLKVMDELSDYKCKVIGSPSDTRLFWMWNILKEQFPDIEFIEATKDVNSHYKEASCILITSPAEGIPLVLCEAQGFGVKAFHIKNLGSTPESGSEECFDINEMVDKVVNYQDTEFNRLINRAKADKFSIDVCIDKWIRVLQDVL